MKESMRWHKWTIVFGIAAIAIILVASRFMYVEAYYNHEPVVAVAWLLGGAAVASLLIDIGDEVDEKIFIKEMKKELHKTRS